MLSRRALMLSLLSLAGGIALAAQPWSVSADGAVQSAASAAPGKGGPGKGHGKGGPGKGHAGGKTSGATGKGAGKSKSKKSGKSPGATLDVRHPDGTQERIRKNRYIMKDAKGRTIVDRPAKRPDRLRLNKLSKR